MLSPLELFEQQVDNLNNPIKDKILVNWEKIKYSGFTNNSLEIRISDGKGMGVFAKEDIKENTIIEYAYCIIYDWRSKYQNDSTIKRYSYGIHCDCNECIEHGIRRIQPLGYGSIYNSADSEDQRNANYYVFQKERLIAYEANRDIKSGEEILLWFGQPYYDSWIKNLKDKNRINH